MVSRIAARAATLATLAQRGRVVPELQRRGVTAVRERVVRPYRILFLVQPKQVLIAAVFDSRRDLEEVLFERYLEIEEGGRAS